MRIFIGHDPREQEAYDVCAHSIRRHASIPVDIEPISSAHPAYRRTSYMKNGQRYDQQDGKPFSTEFSFARFLVPVDLSALPKDCGIKVDARDRALVLRWGTV